jgi:hypothetical protein
VTSACSEPPLAPVHSDRLSAIIDLLGNEDPAVREKAFRDLRNAGLTAVPSVKDALAKARDPEVKARLEELFRRFAWDEAQALYKEGRLDAALLKFAEAEGALDPAAYVADRVARTKQDILGYMPDPSIPGGVCAKRSAVADTILRKGYGPWMMPVLLEALGLSVVETEIPADLVLKTLAEEATPFLCQALQSSNKRLAYRALSIFHWQSGSKDQRVQAALRTILTDPELSEDARYMARWTYRWSTGVFPDEDN